MPTRRTLLTTLAALATTGCTTTPDRTPTSTLTPRPTATASETIRIDKLQLDGGSYEARKYLRYYDSVADKLKHLEPSYGRWIYVRLYYTNLGGPTTVPGYPATKLAVGTTTYTTTRTPLPIDWEDARPRNTDGMAWLNPRYAGIPTELDGGESQMVDILYDAEPPADQPVQLHVDAAGKTHTLALHDATELAL